MSYEYIKVLDSLENISKNETEYSVDSDMGDRHINRFLQISKFSTYENKCIL